MPLDLDVSLAQWTGIATYPPGATFGPRVMRDYELVWMIEGDAVYRWDGHTVDASQGSIVLCRPRTNDFFRWDPSRRTRHAYVHFNVNRMPKAWPKPAEWPVVRSFTDRDIAAPLFRHLMAWHGSGGDDALVRLTLAHLLAVFVTGQGAIADVPAAALPEPVERALAHLYKTLDRDAAAAVSFEELVEASCVTGPHLCRLFKRTTGHTPAETVRLARLDRALELVVRSNFAVKQIAAMSGFASPFHFTRVFTKAFGVAPVTLRKDVEAGRTPPPSKMLRNWRA